MKKGTKVLGLFLLSLVLFSIVLSFASAEDYTPQAVAVTNAALASTKVIFTDALAPLYNADDGGWMIKALLAVLLYMILYSAIGLIFGSGKKSTIFISLLVTLIAILAMPKGILETIGSTYGAMGTAILLVIPFMIIMVFTLRVGSLLVGRMLWIFFCLYYFALILYRWATTPGLTLLSSENIPYIFAIAAGGLIFFLLGAIRKVLFRGEMDAIKESGIKVAEEGKLLRKLKHNELKEVYGAEDTGND